MTYFWNHFFDALIPICICVVLPTLVIWLIGRVKQNETNRKAEIMLKALDNGAIIDSDYLKGLSGSKTIKERLLGRLTGASVTGVLGLALILVALIPDWPGEWVFSDSPAPMLVILGGILLAIGIALFIVYFTGKKLMAKEIVSEEKQILGEK
jgi:hypothetical protein